jgi:hypothetical protein
MGRIVLAFLLFTIGPFAQADEIPWRAQSLSAAKELCRLDPTKHVLVFYTDYRT